jgi:hypothetical protein
VTNVVSALVVVVVTPHVGCNCSRFAGALPRGAVLSP